MTNLDVFKIMLVPSAAVLVSIGALPGSAESDPVATPLVGVGFATDKLRCSFHHSELIQKCHLHSNAISYLPHQLLHVLTESSTVQHVDCV